jgi:hypothetical protein
MTERRDENNSTAEEILKRLVRLARRDSEVEFVRPSDESIDAYFDGTATDSQREDMENALIASAEFRKEIRDMAIDIGLIEQEDYSKKREDETAIAVPDHELFLTEQARKRGAEEQITDGLWRKIIVFARLHNAKIIPVAAAAVIILILVQIGVFAPGDYLTVKWELMETVETPYLIANITKSADEQGAPKSYLTGREAAINKIRESVALDGTQLVIIHPDQAFHDPNLVWYTLVSKSRDTLAKISGHIRIDATQASSFRAWMLVLPSRNLYYSDISVKTGMMQWSIDEVGMGSLTISYKDSTGFHALDAVRVNLE